jgi:hypothetical protein
LRRILYLFGTAVVIIGLGLIGLHEKGTSLEPMVQSGPLRIEKGLAAGSLKRLDPATVAVRRQTGWQAARKDHLLGRGPESPQKGSQLHRVLLGELGSLLVQGRTRDTGRIEYGHAMTRLTGHDNEVGGYPSSFETGPDELACLTCNESAGHDGNSERPESPRDVDPLAPRLGHHGPDVVTDPGSELGDHGETIECRVRGDGDEQIDLTRSGTEPPPS